MGVPKDSGLKLKTFYLDERQRAFLRDQRQRTHKTESVIVRELVDAAMRETPVAEPEPEETTAAEIAEVLQVLRVLKRKRKGGKAIGLVALATMLAGPRAQAAMAGEDEGRAVASGKGEFTRRRPASRKPARRAA